MLEPCTLVGVRGKLPYLRQSTGLQAVDGVIAVAVKFIPVTLDDVIVTGCDVGEKE